MLLFEEKERIIFEEDQYGVSIFEYLDSSIESRIKIFRDTLNDWFTRYPKSHQKELKASFRNNFYTSMYELFIHELFLKQGFKLYPHPTLPNSPKQPDFLAVKGSTEFYIEATVITGLSEKDIKRQNFLDNLINQLQKIDSPNCWLAIYDIEVKTQEQPTIRKIRLAIEKRLSNIDPDKLALILERNPIGFEKFKYEDNNIKIIFAALPKNKEIRNKKGIKPIGLQYSGININSASSDSDLIKESFKGKALKYGNLDKPFLICINLDNIKFNFNYDINWAFLDNDGIFSHSNHKFTRTSGVFLTRFVANNLVNSPHRLILHPYAQQKLDVESLLLSYEVPNNHTSTLFERLSVESIITTNPTTP